MKSDTFRLALVVVALLVTVGCTADDSGEDADLLAPELLVASELEYLDLRSDSRAQYVEDHYDNGRLEESVSACMQAQGFVYEVVPPVDLLLPRDDLIDEIRRAADMDPYSHGYRTEYGYGISTLDALLIVDRPADPNFEQFEVLDDAGQAAYLGALYGESDGDDVAGCVGDAYADLAEPGLDYDRYDQLGRINETMTERLRGSRDYTQAVQRWSECVAAEGFDFSEPGQVEMWVRTLLDEIDRTRLLEQGFDVVESGEVPDDVELDSIVVDASEALLDAGGSPYDIDRLREVQDAETRLAVLALPCDRTFAREVKDLKTKISIQLAQDLN